jgi:hypothetical protein
MELDLSDLHLPHQQQTLIALFLGIGLLLSGVAGWRFTPVDAAGTPQVLTWSEWHVLRAAREYRTELARLQREVDGLAGLLAQSADPVRAQITAEHITRSFAEGQPALERPRQLVIAAAVAVQEWSVGVISLSEAQQALQEAVSALQDASQEP